MLSDDVGRYVEQHRALGYKYRIQSGLLRSFAAFAIERGEDVVRARSVLEWAEQGPSPAQRRNRLLTVRRFALAMRAENGAYEVPAAGSFGQEAFTRCTPHIYTAEQIAALLQAAAQLRPADSFRAATYVTLLGLLAATGMRSCEALNLRLQDLTDDGLRVRETKFRKSRLLPLHPTARDALNRYLDRRLCLGSTDPAIFVSRKGHGLSYNTLEHVFLALARGSGLRGGPGRPGPRLHDLRHTFAVRSLEQCDPEPQAIKRHMVALSTYLGHAHVTDTYWYLQATPGLMTQIGAAGESLYCGVSS